MRNVTDAPAAVVTKDNADGLLQCGIAARSGLIWVSPDSIRLPHYPRTSMKTKVAQGA